MLVLLADKDPFELEAMRVALSSTGLEVVTTHDGDEVLKLARERQPQVVVAGASLWQMGGFAVSRELKTMAGQGLLPEPAVIVILERTADSWLARWSRCDAWRAKPLDFEDLEQLVLDLGRRKQTPEGVS